MSIDFTAELVSADGRNVEHVPDAPVANLANGNAAMLLRTLGFDDPDPEQFWSGSVPADQFAERLAVAEFCDPQVARPAQTSGGDGRITVHDLGTTSDYLARRFADLAAVVAAARDAGGNVAWM